MRFERLDDDSECDGLLPDRAPEPVEATRQQIPSAVCSGGISDGTGHVALAIRTRSGDGAGWQAFAPDGTPLRSFAAWPVVPGPSGFHGLTIQPRENTGTTVTHQAYGPDGARLGEGAVNSAADAFTSGAWALGQDPQGGCFAVVGEVDMFHNHWTRLEAQRFDERGAPRWQQNLAFGDSSEHSFIFVAAGVSVRGEALALRQDASWIDATWLDAAGATVAEQPQAEPYRTLTGSDAFRPYRVELAPLLDGALAVRVDGAFTRVYRHLATTSEPLPPWLAARSGWSFRFTRGNRGYALFPPARELAPACDQHVELRAPSGRLCGRVTLVGDGAPCLTGLVDQGWDGTVVQQRESIACRWRWWPGLLAR